MHVGQTIVQQHQPRRALVEARQGRRSVRGADRAMADRSQTALDQLLQRHVVFDDENQLRDLPGGRAAPAVVLFPTGDDMVVSSLLSLRMSLSASNCGLFYIRRVLHCNSMRPEGCGVFSWRWRQSECGEESP